MASDARRENSGDRDGAADQDRPPGRLSHASAPASRVSLLVAEPRRFRLAARYVRVLLTCWHSHHQADVDLQGVARQSECDGRRIEPQRSVAPTIIVVLGAAHCKTYDTYILAYYPSGASTNVSLGLLSDALINVRPHTTHHNFLTFRVCALGWLKAILHPPLPVSEGGLRLPPSRPVLFPLSIPFPIPRSAPSARKERA
jgi:hypothetical protein